MRVKRTTTMRGSDGIVLECTSHLRVLAPLAPMVNKVSAAQSQMRQFVAKEILQTEKSYVNSLKLIVNGLHTPAQKVLDEKELEMIFSNVVEV